MEKGFVIGLLIIGAVFIFFKTWDNKHGNSKVYSWSSLRERKDALFFIHEVIVMLKIINKKFMRSTFKI